MCVHSKSDDINIYTKTNAAWNVFLLEELQQTFINFGVSHAIHSHQYKDSELTYENSTIEDLLTDDTNDFLSKLEDLSGLGILKIKPELSIKGIGYEMYNISPEIKVNSVNSGVGINARVSLNGMDIFAESFNINFVLPNLINGKKVTALEVKMLKPRLNFSQGVTLPFELGLMLQKAKKGLKVSFSKLELKELANALVNSQHAFDYDFKSLHISDVSLEIMGRTVIVDEKKIVSTIMDNKENLKKIVIEQLASILATDGILALVKVFDGQIFPDEYWFNTKNDKKYPLVLKINELAAPEKNILKLSMNGDFCSKVNFEVNKKNCVNKKLIPSTQRQIPKADMIKSDELILNKLRSTDRQLTASIAEAYFTKLIHGTIENKEWDDLLEEFEIKLGNQKVFIQFDEEGEFAKVYIDAIYRVGKLKGLLIGQRNVNFPIVLKVKPRVEYLEVDYQDNEKGLVKNEQLPHIVFSIMDVVLEDSVLRNGIPEYNLKSSISRITFGLRGLVIRKIRKELFQFDQETQDNSNGKWVGVDLPALLFPELSNLHLEKLNFSSDGLGRGNFSFDGRDILIREIE